MFIISNVVEKSLTEKNMIIVIKKDLTEIKSFFLNFMKCHVSVLAPHPNSQ